MHQFASFNQEIFPANEINLKAVSSAGLYGRGVFTTLAIFNSKPFLWEKHWHRLNENGRRIGLELSDFSENGVYQSLEELVDKNNISKARCRITFFDERSPGLWRVSDKNQTSILIQTADFQESKQNLSVGLSSFQVNSTSPLAGIKSCSYLDNVLALENARKNGFNEAVRLNERGEIVSGCLANVFWIRHGEIFTPSLRTGCLAGTTREFLLENFEISEVKASISELEVADEVFITSSGVGLKRVFYKNKIRGETQEFVQLKQMFDLATFPS